MIVKDLPKKLRQLAMYRSRQQFEIPYFDIMYFYSNFTVGVSLCMIFDWEKTPEGVDFWLAVNQGKITELPK